MLNGSTHGLRRSSRAASAAVAVLFCVVVLLIAVNAVFPVRHYSAVRAESKRFNVSESLVLAVMWTESKLDSKAVSKAGAIGLMQLMPKTAEWCCAMLSERYEKSRLFDADFNIKLGTYYLSYLIKKFGEDGAIAAYNAGEGNYVSWQGEIRFPETRQYIKRVSLARRVYSLLL